MTSLVPQRSDGLLVASLGDLVVVYDLITQTRHLLKPEAARLLEACDGSAERPDDETVLVPLFGADSDWLGDALDSALEQFESLGLVNRPTAWEPPLPIATPLIQASTALVSGAAHCVLDQTIRFRTADRELLSQVDNYLGTGGASSGDDRQGEHRGPVLEFELSRLPNGEFRLVTSEVADHADLFTLLSRLVTVNNAYAVSTHGCVALHAGGVRLTSGHIVVLPGASGRGKSTLTAAMVSAGCDYLGDEVIGIDVDGTALGYPKRIAIDPVGRAMVNVEPTPDGTVDPVEIRVDVQRLGGRVGAVSRTFFPRYEPGASCTVEPLDLYGCLDELLANTLNLARVGQSGLEALCALAESVDAYRLTYGDATEAAAAISALVG